MQIQYSGEIANTAAVGKQTAFTTTSTTAPVLSGIGAVVSPLNGSAVYISGSATLSNTTSTDGAIMDLYYAPASSVPSAGTAVTGYTAYGLAATVTGSAVVPIDAFITGLTPGVSYVFTLGVEAVTGGTASMILEGLKIKDTI